MAGPYSVRAGGGAVFCAESGVCSDLLHHQRKYFSLPVP